MQDTVLRTFTHIKSVNSFDPCSSTIRPVLSLRPNFIDEAPNSWMSCPWFPCWPLASIGIVIHTHTLHLLAFCMLFCQPVAFIFANHMSCLMKLAQLRSLCVFIPAALSKSILSSIQVFFSLLPYAFIFFLRLFVHFFGTNIY